MTRRRHLSTVPPAPDAPGGAADTPSAELDSIVISCDTCVRRNTDACRDCVVTFLLDSAATSADPEPVRFTVDEVDAIARLADAGLVPTLKHLRAG